MFKKSILTILSLAFALNCFQQMHAEPVVQDSNKYSVLKNAVKNYGKPVMDIGSLALGSYMARHWCLLTEEEQKYKWMVDHLSPEEREMSDLAGTMAVGTAMGCAVGYYAFKNLYDTYKEYKYGKKEVELEKHSRKLTALAVGKSLFALMGVIQLGELLFYNNYYRTKFSSPYMLTFIACCAKAAYLTGIDAYTYWTTKKQVSETKKA